MEHIGHASVMTRLAVAMTRPYRASEHRSSHPSGPTVGRPPVWDGGAPQRVGEFGRSQGSQSSSKVGWANGGLGVPVKPFWVYIF